MGTRADLAVLEAVRALDEQRSTVDTLQARAGVLFAGAAAANVGLTQLAFGGQGRLPYPVVSVVGIGGALVSFLGLLWLAWPHTIVVTTDPVALMAGSGVWSVADSDLDRTTVDLMMKQWSANHDRLERLYCVLRCSLSALLVNAVCFAVVALLRRGLS